MREGVEAVIVGGGDGTVSDAARELVKTKVALGILPIGTFNNIARSVGVVGDLEAGCAIIAEGHTREIDIGLANGRQYFFEAAGAGLDATLFPIGEEIKGGHWSRIFTALKLTFQYRAQPVAITFDRKIDEALRVQVRVRLSKRLRQQRTIRRNALLVVAANGPYYGGGFTVAPDARLEDGLLTLSVYRRFSKLELARHFLAISLGKYSYSPKIETYHAGMLSIVSPASLPVHLDGKPFEKLPITLEAMPRALRVFVPGRSQPRTNADSLVPRPVPEDRREDLHEK